MKKISFLFLLSIILISCKEEVKPLVFSEFNFTSEEDAIIEINVPKFKETNEASFKINSSVENFIAKSIASNIRDFEKTSIKGASEWFEKEYIFFTSEFPESTQAWEALIDGEVTYQSEDIITIAITSYINTGGAHGNNNITFLNFNSKNGALYNPSELIKNALGLKLLAQNVFNEKIAKNSPDNYFFGEDFHLPANIGYSEDGLIFLYNVYEIAPYSEGIIEFSIPFEEVNDFLNVY